MRRGVFTSLLLLALLATSCQSGNDGRDLTSVLDVQQDVQQDAIEDADTGLPAPKPPFASPEWITDRQGRVLILRGVNVIMGAKSYPDGLAHFSPEDARRIARDAGFDFVRLPMLWEALEPRAGEIQAAYLDAIAARVDMLWAEGIRVMLDMHQDVFARRFCCDGAPEWAIRDDGLAFEMQSQWFLNYFQPAVMRAFDNFWDFNGPNKDVQAHFVNAWAAVAARFKDHPGVIGYDIFNEPHPGSDVDVGELLGMPDPASTHVVFDQQKLTPFYQRAIDAIRVVDPDHWIFVEPRYGAPGNGMPSHLGRLLDPRTGPARIVYSPHLYSLDVEQNAAYDRVSDTCIPDFERERLVEITRQPMPVVLGEWGLALNAAQSLDFVTDVMAMADRLRAGFAYWPYDAGDWSPWNDDRTPRPALGVITRPYPRAVAGVPTAFSYDTGTRVFRLQFEDRDEVTGPTEIALVALRHYPTGWTVTTSDAVGTWTSSFDADRQILAVVTPRTGGAHTIEIHPSEVAQ